MLIKDFTSYRAVFILSKCSTSFDVPNFLSPVRIPNQEKTLSREQEIFTAFCTMDSDQASWQEFFAACLQKRVSSDQFQTLLKIFRSKHVTSPRHHVANVLVEETRKTAFLDPRSVLYMRDLLRMRIIRAADVLDSIIPLTNSDLPVPIIDYYDDPITGQESHKVSFESMVLQMLTAEVVQGILKSVEEIRSLLKSLIAWMIIYPNSNVLGYLISASLSSPMAHDAVSQPSAKCTQEIRFDIRVIIPAYK